MEDNCWEDNCWVSSSRYFRYQSISTLHVPKHLLSLSLVQMSLVSGDDELWVTQAMLVASPPLLPSQQLPESPQSRVGGPTGLSRHRPADIPCCLLPFLLAIGELKVGCTPMVPLTLTEGRALLCPFKSQDNSQQKLIICKSLQH